MVKYCIANLYVHSRNLCYVMLRQYRHPHAVTATDTDDAIRPPTEGQTGVLRHETSQQLCLLKELKTTQ